MILPVAKVNFYAFYTVFNFSLLDDTYINLFSAKQVNHYNYIIKSLHELQSYNNKLIALNSVGYQLITTRVSGILIVS